MLERAQEIDDVLLLRNARPVETLDDRACLAATAIVSLNRLDQIRRSSVVQEEDALPNAPQRSGSKLIWTRATLRDAVRQSLSHVVDEQVGPEVHRLVGQREAWAGRRSACDRLARGERLGMAVDAACRCERGPSIHDGRGIRSGRWRGQHPREIGERLNV